MHIGQVIMSIRTKAQNKEHVVEALRRAKFKFPGRQKVTKTPGTPPLIHLGVGGGLKRVMDPPQGPLVRAEGFRK